MSNGVNVAALGLGGIDTTGLVQSLVSIEQQPLNNMASQQQNIQSASSMISSFSSTLSALKNASAALSDPNAFLAMAASSSDPSVVATTSSGSAQPGQWTVNVTQVAQAQRTLTNGTSNPTANLGMGGKLNISVGSGSPVAIDLSGKSLTDIANEIASSGLRVQASVVYTGSQYRLMIAGLDTGGANTISFDESQATFGGAYSLGLDGTADPTTHVPLYDPNYNANATFMSAQDASVQVGGSHGYTVTSATNQITNAIPGVTLAVTQPTTTPATVTIGSDPNSIEKKVQSFVTAYNTAVTNGHSAAGYGKQKAANSLLQGDVAIRSSLGQMEHLVAEQVPGSTGAYTTLASVGIALNDDGTLSFDQSKFASGLQTDPASVQRLFVTNPANGSPGVMAAFGSAIDQLIDPASGTVTAETTALNSRSRQLTKEMTDAQLRIDQYTTKLQNQFANMNATLAKYKRISSAITPQGSNNNSNGIF